MNTFDAVVNGFNATDVYNGNTVTVAGADNNNDTFRCS